MVARVVVVGFVLALTWVRRLRRRDCVVWNVVVEDEDSGGAICEANWVSRERAVGCTDCAGCEDAEGAGRGGASAGTLLGESWFVILISCIPRSSSLRSDLRNSRTIHNWAWAL